MAAANSKTAKLIMQLVDRVSGPARAIKGSLTALNTATEKVTGSSRTVGRALGDGGRRLRRFSYDTGGIGLPLSLGAAAAARSVYQFEKAGNKMQAFGLLTKNQREELEKYAQVLNKDFPFTNRQIIEAAQELFRAGLTYEQAMGALRGTLNLSLAGDLSNKEATDIATNVMTAMKLPMQTFEQVQASLLKVNNALAWAATSSNTDVRLMGDTFRYVAPLAAAAGISLEEVTAVSAELARNGIKGAEAGVALRSALVRMAKPTKPMLAAFERLGLNMADFVKYKEKIEAGEILAVLRASGINADDIAGEIQAILDDKTLAGSPVRMAANLTDLIVSAMGDEALREEISSAVQDAVTVGAQRVDLIALLRTLREKGANISDLVRIFDVRMGSRLAAVLYSDLDAAVERMAAESPGIARRMAELMMQGVVGATARLAAATERMVRAIAESGVLDRVTDLMDRFSALLKRLSEVNPRILELGTYGILAAGALAPLGLALGGVATAVGAIVSPLGLVIAGLGTLAAFKWDELNAGMAGLSRGFSENLSPETLERFNTASDKYKKFVDWLSNSKPGDVDKSRSGGDSIGKFHADMANFHSDNLNTIENEWLPAIDELLKRIGRGWRDLDAFFSKPIGSEFFESMIGGFSNVASKIDKFLSRPVAAEMFGSIGAKFETLQIDIGKFADTTSRSMSRFVEGITERFRDFPNVDGVLDRFETLRSGITNISTLALEPVVSLIDDLKAAWRDLDAFFAMPIGQEVFASIGSGFDAIGLKLGELRNLPGYVIADFDRLVGLLDGLSFDGILTNISSFSSGAVKKVGGLGSSISNALETLPGQLYKIGVDAIQQLLEGMKAKAMELVNWATKLGNRISVSIRSGLSSIGGFVFGDGEAGTAPTSAPGEAPASEAPPSPGRRGRNRRRAAGGPVRAGMTYEVGERGPELFTPERNGYVTPNHRAFPARDGGQFAGQRSERNVVIQRMEANISVNGTGDPERVAQVIGLKLREMLQDSRQTSLEGGPVCG